MAYIDLDKTYKQISEEDDEEYDETHFGDEEDN